MKNRWILTALSFVLGGTITLYAQESLLNLLGAQNAYTIYERYLMSVGIDNLGNPLPQKRLVETREHVVVPRHYGELIEITVVGDKTILWFEDGEGYLRNAIVSGANEKLLRLERRPTERFEARLRF